MTKELTFQQISTVYGMHIGCEVWAPDPSEEQEFRKGYITGYSGEFEVEIQFIEDDGNVYESACYELHGKAKLILTPLSEITDKDAIEVARLIRPANNYKVIRHGKHIYYVDVTELSFAALNVNIFFLNGKITPTFNKEPTGECTRDAVDYLRSRGYMLPYMGIDLYEAGIAIKPSDLNNDTLHIPRSLRIQ